MGAITGIKSLFIKFWTISVSTFFIFPTNPSLGLSCSHSIIFASFPDSPTPFPPWLLIALTIDLLTLPDSTISTTSIVLPSVILFPSANSLSIFKSDNTLLIIGPPPCTITGLTPHCFIKTISRAKFSIEGLLVMA